MQLGINNCTLTAVVPLSKDNSIQGQVFSVITAAIVKYVTQMAITVTA